MFPNVWRFFFDPAYFVATMATCTLASRVRGLVAAVGMLMLTGVLPLAWFGETFGEIGWWGGRILLVVAFFIRSGDNTIKTLENLSPEKAEDLLRKLDLSRRSTMPTP